MLTVPEAARQTGRDPETIRRWIRSGKLRARKIGTQHVIEDADLDELLSPSFPLPKAWQTTVTGEPMPDMVSIIREIRDAE